MFSVSLSKPYKRDFRTAKPKPGLPQFHTDKYFVFAIVALLLFGLVMVSSASMAISERLYHSPFHFLMRQLVYVVLGVCAGLYVLRIPVERWQAKSGLLLLIGLFLLLVVLVPGLGRHINGSTRWVGVGPVNLQVSEFVKLAMVIFMAGYLTRRNHELKTTMVGFLKPIFILGIIAVLLLKEPDFGALSVVAVTVLCMMFIAGMRVWPFAVLAALIVAALAVIAISSPYRLERLTTYLNPWAHAYGSGYQLTQSLIAFGRGGIFGVGLGGSVQKLFYLPEAHTDFLFSVLAEELGLIGIVATMLLYVLLVWRSLLIGRRAQAAGLNEGALMAYGFAIWMAIQAAVNMGVTSGLLPTKGLTLPLMSYGGSGIVIDCIVMGMLLRIDHEAFQEGPMAEHRMAKQR
ncbi:MAG: putative lipid II flippase FtsW [Gammaproteobacteria bacterium CG11_big_fil_rev_8_21_14_0_20_46_22]|nr:MAG: putative lipid II flippase FtsW [Gammaproteobacteria bacterium CG12_big_fil_rev_8_21_14_0_65_46_12]PIR10813.1 MAG: putative lipid II flippase FtsW [Gammaproteobacteria bacterium CG11_big_fil_rev_8_21_14_0_20_46_22]